MTAVWAPITSLFSRRRQRAGRGAGEEGDRHPLDLGEQGPAEVVDQALADARAAPPLQHGQRGVAERGERRRATASHVIIARSSLGIAVSRIGPDDERRDERQQGGDEDGHQEQGDGAAVRTGERPDPPQRGRARAVAPATASASRWCMVRWAHPHGSEATKPTRRMCPRTLRRHGEMYPVGARARSVGALVVTAAACGSDSGVSTDRADPARPATTDADVTPPTEAPRRRPRRPTAPTTDEPATDDRPARRRRRPDGRPPAGPRRRSTGRTTTRRARRRPPCSRCPSTTTIPTGRRSSSSSPATSPTDQDEQDRLAARQPRRARVRRQRLRPVRRADLRRAAARALRHRRLGPSRHRAQRAGHRLHRRLRRAARAAPTSRPTTTPSASSSSTGAEELRRRPAWPRTATSSSTSARTTAPATWTRCARRSARTRSATSASATAASSARRGPRCSPTPCGPPSSTAPATPTPAMLEGGLQQTKGFEGTLDHVPRVVQRRHVVPVPQRRRRRGRVRRADGRARRAADPQRGRAARRHPRHGARRRRPGDVLARRSGTSCPRRWPPPSAATAPACSRCTTPTTSATPTARGATSSRRSRRSAAPTSADRPTVAEDDATAAQFTRGRAAVRARHHRRVLLHVLPAVDRPAGRRSPAPAPGRSSSSARPATRRRRWRAPRAMARRWRTAGSSSSPPTSTPATRSTTASTTSSTTTSSTSRSPRRRRPADARPAGCDRSERSDPVAVARATTIRTETGHGGGRSGIRTHGGPKDLNGFRGRPIRPLWHPSGAGG